MTSDGLLFPEDRDKERRRQEWERQSRIYGTEEFDQAYAIYIRTSKWKKLCQEVKKRANGRCEECGPNTISLPPFQVHHLTYERFMNELLSDLKYLCLHHHEIADRERKKQTQRANQRAYEEAGEDALEAARMNGFFRAKYGDDWGDHFGSDMASAYEEWDEQKRDWDEERG